jgi:hypothetical protein
MKYSILLLLLLISCKQNTIVYSKHERVEYYYMIGSHKHYDTIKEYNKQYIHSKTIYYFKTNNGIEYVDEITYYYHTIN